MKRLFMLVVCAAPAFAQTVAVPFVGCPGDGMVGPVDAPKGTAVSLRISAEAATALAYYQAGMTAGVLGPRDWRCFGTYGSGGSTLFITPDPVDGTGLSRKDMDGDGIELAFRNGETSGRFSVGAVIARVFPAYSDFVTRLDEPHQAFATGPYPNDKLTYKSKSVVEYRTPAGVDGLGTYGGLKKNGTPIDGVAMLVGPPPDLVLLAVRLPDKLRGLARIIVSHLEEHPVAQ